MGLRSLVVAARKQESAAKNVGLPYALYFILLPLSHFVF